MTFQPIVRPLVIALLVLGVRVVAVLPRESAAARRPSRAEGQTGA